MAEATPFRILLTGTGSTHGDYWNRMDLSDKEKLDLAMAADSNPAWSAVRTLEGAVLVTETRPVHFSTMHLALSDTYADAPTRMETVHEKGGFDAMIQVGTNFGFDRVNIERIAHRYGYWAVDIHGKYPESDGTHRGYIDSRFADDAVGEGEDQHLRSVVDCDKLETAVRAAGFLETFASDNQYKYFCNWVYFASLSAALRKAKRAGEAVKPVVWLHISRPGQPYTIEQSIEIIKIVARELVKMHGAGGA